MVSGFVFLPSQAGAALCADPNVCQGTPPTAVCDAAAGFRAVSGDCPGGQVCCALSTGTGSSFTFFNPLKFPSVEGVLTSLLGTLRNIIVILAIIFIIIGALMYILSAGNEGRMTTAKGAILAAMIGLALAVAAPSFLKELAAILGWQNVNDAQVAGAQTFTQIATKVLNFLLSIVGIIAIIMLVFGGFTYLTAAGDEGKAETGKKIVTYAVIAIAVALSALVLVTQVTKFFV